MRLKGSKLINDTQIVDIDYNNVDTIIDIVTNDDFMVAYFELTKKEKITGKTEIFVSYKDLLDLYSVTMNIVKVYNRTNITETEKINYFEQNLPINAEIISMNNQYNQNYLDRVHSMFQTIDDVLDDLSTTVKKSDGEIDYNKFVARFVLV